MKLISSEAAAFIRKNYPAIHIAMAGQKKKADRKKYFIEETQKSATVLKEFEKDGGGCS